MATNAITSSLLSTIFDSSPTANQFATNLNRLAKDLQNGNLSGAQQDYVTLSQNLQNGGGASSASTSDSGVTVSLLSDISGSSSSLSTFTNELNQIGTNLQNGDLGAAQQDLLSLDATALNAASSTSTAASGSTAASATSHANTTTLIRSIVQALSAGDSSSASLGLSQLASVSTSAKGASYLQQLSSSLGSNSTSSTSSVSQLVQSAGASSASSTLSLLA